MQQTIISFFIVQSSSQVNCIILTSYMWCLLIAVPLVYIGEFLFVGCETAPGVVPTVRCKKFVRRDVQWRSLTHPNLRDICERIKQQPRTDWLRTFIDNTSEKLKFGSPKWMVRKWFSWSQTFFRFHVFWAAKSLKFSKCSAHLKTILRRICFLFFFVWRFCFKLCGGACLCYIYFLVIYIYIYIN